MEHLDRKQHMYRCAVALFVLLSGTGCDHFTDVHAPDVVQPDALENALGAETLRAGAVGLFANVYAEHIVTAGVIGDEFTSAAVGGAFTRFADSRSLPDPGSTFSPYPALSTARVNSLLALSAMQRYVPQARVKIAQLFAQVGYIELFLAETMCSGVPLSMIENGNPVHGPPLTTAELLTRSIADFDSATFYAADSARVLHMTSVARGRALLQQGRFSEAAQAVAAVPTNYVFVAEFSTAQPNGVYQQINVNRNVSVSNQEGVNGLPFRSANDPRVRSLPLGKGADGTTDLFTFEKYNGPGVALHIASGIEARLIEAEAEFQANPNDASTTGAGWLGILNTLRATAITPVLPPLSDPGRVGARADLLFRERAFWLFGTGHRQGDLRRLVRQYARDREQVFPTGSYKRQGVYGPDITVPVDPRELPNPNWTGKCVDRDA